MFWPRTSNCETVIEFKNPLLRHTAGVQSSAGFADSCTSSACQDPGVRLDHLLQQSSALSKRQERLFGQHMEDVISRRTSSKAGLQKKAEYDAVKRQLQEVWADIMNQSRSLR